MITELVTVADPLRPVKYTPPWPMPATLVPLLLQQGLQQSWYGLGVLSAVLTFASWWNWPAEAKVDAVAEWVATHEKYAAFMHGIWADCTPSYFNNEGHPSKILTRNGGFGGGVLMFVDILARWRSEGTLAGLELVK